MPWIEAIKAAIIAVPKLVDLFQGLLGRLDAVREAIQAKQIQEIRNAQNQLARDILAVKDDQSRADLVRRLSELERGITHKP